MPQDTTKLLGSNMNRQMNGVTLSRMTQLLASRERLVNDQTVVFQRENYGGTDGSTNGDRL